MCCSIAGLKRRAGDDISGAMEYEIEGGEPPPCNSFAAFNEQLPHWREKAPEMLAKLDNDHKAFDARAMTRITGGSLPEDLSSGIGVRRRTQDRGLRSKYEFEKRLEPLRAFCGKKVRAVTHGDLVRYKTKGLKTAVVIGRNTRGTKRKANPKSREGDCNSGSLPLSFLRRILIEQDNSSLATRTD
jgi:hypothetical protein